MTKDKKEVPVDEALLVILMEILIRKFGEEDTILIPNFREQIVGAPRRFALWAALIGDQDLMVGIDAYSTETISMEDLQEAESEIDEEKVH